MAAFYDYFNEQKYADAVKNVSCLFVLSNLFRVRWINCSPPFATPHPIHFSVELISASYQCCVSAMHEDRLFHLDYDITLNAAFKS